MVEVSNRWRFVGWRWRAVVIGVTFIAAAVAGFWAVAGVDDGFRGHPGVRVAFQTTGILFLAACAAVVAIALWDRVRQPWPESEQEISFAAFSDTSKGLVRPVLKSLTVSFLILQGLVRFLFLALSLVEQQAWLKVFAATPYLLCLLVVLILPYPALMKDWRSRRAAAGT